MAIPWHGPDMRYFAILLGLLLWAGPVRAQESAACAALVSAMGGGMQARFLPSYPTSADPALKDAAFLYDNAVAAIALTGCGRRDLGARIGDAILRALAQDRHWRDGRLRNAYLAGVVDAEPVKLPGWYDARQDRWVEDRYQVSSDTGNLAWAMLALLALDDDAADRRYRDGAARIGRFLLRWQTSGTPGGFTVGTLGHEPAPLAPPWKSTEHNTDLAAAFTGLVQTDGPRWREPAAAAARFVAAMWDEGCRCLSVGTGADGATPNRFLALDAQVWPLLALPHPAARRAQIITTVRARLAAEGGYTYGAAARGFWSEGTAQMALLLRLAGEEKEAAGLMRALGAQRSTGGYYNAAAATLDTGFASDSDPKQARHYFRLPHLGATAWVALAEQSFNPFTRRRALPQR